MKLKRSSLKGLGLSAKWPPEYQVLYALRHHSQWVIWKPLNNGPTLLASGLEISPHERAHFLNQLHKLGLLDKQRSASGARLGRLGQKSVVCYRINEAGKRLLKELGV